MQRLDKERLEEIKPSLNYILVRRYLTHVNHKL